MPDARRANPTWQCQRCREYEVVTPGGRGFPPLAAKKRLVKRCKTRGHVCRPVYQAGVRLATLTTEADEQWLRDTYGKGSKELAEEAERE